MAEEQKRSEIENEKRGHNETAPTDRKLTLSSSGTRKFNLTQRKFKP